MSPASEDWFPPSKSIVSFLRSTADRSKGSGVSSVMVAVARCDYAKHFVFIPIRYVNLAICARVFRHFLTPGALSRLEAGHKWREVEPSGWAPTRLGKME